MSKLTAVGSEDQLNPGSVQAEADRLKREHNELKMRLLELNSRPWLSPTEEYEKKQLQKLKLAKKDRLAALMVNYSGSS